MANSKKGQDILQKESAEMENKKFVVAEHLLLKSETFDTNHYQHNPLSAKYLQGVGQLLKMFDMLPNESVNYQSDLPTSSVAVEIEIARCISTLLPDVDKPKSDIPYIQALLKSYRVVLPLSTKTQSVSLHQIHVLLQDNYPNSCFCLLMNILLAEWMGSKSKTIAL